MDKLANAFGAVDERGPNLGGRLGRCRTVHATHLGRLNPGPNRLIVRRPSVQSIDTKTIEPKLSADIGFLGTAVISILTC